MTPAEEAANQAVVAAKAANNQMFLDIVNALSGGLINDMHTAIYGLLAIILIVVALDWIKDVILPAHDSDRARERLKNAADASGRSWESVQKEEVYASRHEWRHKGRGKL